MQRRSLNAVRNIGLSATESARALNVAGFLERLLPPGGHQAPTHRHKLPRPVFIETAHVHRVGRRDVVVRLEIARRTEHAEESVHLCDQPFGLA